MHRSLSTRRRARFRPALALGGGLAALALVSATTIGLEVASPETDITLSEEPLVSSPDIDVARSLSRAFSQVAEAVGPSTPAAGSARRATSVARRFRSSARPMTTATAASSAAAGRARASSCTRTATS